MTPSLLTLLKRLLLGTVVSAILPLALAERGPEPRRIASAEHALEARVIVKYKSDSGLMRALAVTDENNRRPQYAAALSLRLRVPLVNGRVLGSRTQGLKGTGLSSSQLAAQLASQPEVEWAVPDERRRISALPNDPFLPGGQAVITPTVGQWYLRAPDATAVAAINAVGAWEFTTGSAGITVAVLDTGVRLDHPDLQGKLHPGYDFIHDATIGNDGDGRDADPTDPGDWTNAGECGIGEPATNSSWHGTQIAGLIGAASDNAAGMASVGRNVMLLPVRVLGRCGGFDSDIIAAIRWAAGVSNEVGFGASVSVVNAHPAKVINMSFGSQGACLASYRDVLAEVNAVGVTVVAAAGNDNGLAVDSPANCPGAIAVAGVRHVGTKVGYSSIGPEVAVAAPAGNCVNLAGPCLFPLLTTDNSGTTVPLANRFSDSTFPTLGTSFSAPLVAGTVGLMLSANPGLVPARVRSLLQSSARAFPTTGGEAAASACRAPNAVEQLECYCTTTTCGAGLLDASRAVAMALQPTVTAAASSIAPTVGSAVTLDGSSAQALGGRTLVGYQWTLIAGAENASFSGPTNASIATLATTAAGNVTVLLTVSDNTGATATSALAITVIAAPVAVGSGGGGGGGGGGALDVGWLLGLAAIALGLRLTPARQRH